MTFSYANTMHVAEDVLRTACRHISAEDVAQILWGVRYVDDGAKIGGRGRRSGRLRQREHISENRGVVGEKPLVDTELDVACNEDDVSVTVPEFFVAYPRYIFWVSRVFCHAIVGCRSD